MILRNLGFLSDEFKIASLVAEKAEKISQIVIQTKQSNTDGLMAASDIAVQSALGIALVQEIIEDMLQHKTKNNIASGIAIYSSYCSTSSNRYKSYKIKRKCKTSAMKEQGVVLKEVLVQQYKHQILML